MNRHRRSLLLSVSCISLVFLQLHFAHSAMERKASQKSYVCPPHFMRLSYKCYYFSNTTTTWQDAYWRCRDMNTTIATIRNGNQDKIVRRTLEHNNSLPLERWIGGRYDWGTNTWRWAVSGKPVQFHSVDNKLPLYKEDLNWHCIVLDPQKHYHWSARRCTEEKHFVCQTKLRKVNRADKRKLQQQYNSKLNEVDVPVIVANRSRHTTSAQHDRNQLDNNAAAYRSHQQRKKERGRKRIRSHADEQHQAKSRRRQQQVKERNARRKFNYLTYFEATRSPLQPRVAVEKFSF